VFLIFQSNTEPFNTKRAPNVTSCHRENDLSIEDKTLTCKYIGKHDTCITVN